MSFTDKPFYLIILSGILIISACAPKRPLLYPNSHLRTVGQAMAQSDIDDCMRMAENYGTQANAGERVAKKTAEAAVVGGAAGGVSGAVVGHPGRGAAVGAAGAGAGTLTREIFRSGDPDPVFSQFVEKCLQEKGYEPIGWR